MNRSRWPGALEVGHHSRAGSCDVAHAAFFKFTGHQFFEDDPEFIQANAGGVQSRRFHRNAKRATRLELAEPGLLLQFLCGKIK